VIRLGLLKSLAVLVVAACSCSLAMAQTNAHPQRSITLPLISDTPIDFVRPIVAPIARCAAQSDMANRVAFGHDGREPQISLFRLDDKGEVVGERIGINLPKPAALAARLNTPLCLAFHPKLPLLYAWQDLMVPREGEPKDDPANDGFHHLAIYDISSAEPKLIESHGTGEGFARRNEAGSIAVSPDGSRIFVPNLGRKNARGDYLPAIGYFRLNEKGLPIDEDDSATVAGETSKPSKDRVATLGKAARSATYSKDKAAGIHIYATRLTVNTAATFAAYPCGLGYVPISDDITLVAGPLGPITWDETNRLGQFTCLTMYPLAGAGYRYRIASHPTLPVIYLSGVLTSYLYRVHHADGFITMLPQNVTLPSATIYSPPVVLAKRKQIAVGGKSVIWLVKIDEQGNYLPEYVQTAVDSATVDSLVYSEKFDRLYVAIEGPPKK
jgi:hypothetical protein